MSEIKWIKMTINMFEDEKIDFIESLPEADAILIIWVRLLTMAGKCNANGYIFLTEKISYTEEMLAHKFKKPLNTVKLAMQTLKTLEMIEFEDDCLKIVNWEKHQNVEGMDKIREQAKLRNQKYREKKKQFLLSDVTHDVTVTQNDETDIDIDIDKDIDKDTTTIEKIAEAPHEEIINLFNTICISFNPVKQLTNKRKGLINARFRENNNSIEVFKTVFDKMQSSNFLKGGWNTGGKANFDWVILPTNFVNVLEDKYINNASNNTSNSTKQQQNRATNKFHNFNQKMAGMGESQLEDITKKRLAAKLIELKGAGLGAENE